MTDRYSLIVFDWDGTLADSTALIVTAIQAALRDLGLPVPDESAARYIIGLGLDDAIRHVAPTLPRERYGEVATHYRKHYLAHEDDVTLFEGAGELLSALEAAGRFLAVATGKSRSGLDRALQQSGLRSRFHATRCGDEGFPKPHPDMLLHLMDRLGVARQETLMVGDTTHDMQLARNAGVEAVGVAYGAHAREDLAREGARVVVGSVGELRGWLGVGQGAVPGRAPLARS